MFTQPADLLLSHETLSIPVERDGEHQRHRGRNTPHRVDHVVPFKLLRWPLAALAAKDGLYIFPIRTMTSTAITITPIMLLGLSVRANALESLRNPRPD
jgi:hypothetical protein